MNLSSVRRCLRLALVIGLLLMVTQVALGADVTRGERGQSVVKIQELLINQGYLIDKADGIFGNNTEYSVKVFQKDMKLPVTGKVDDATMKAMEENNLKFTKSSVNKSKTLSIVKGEHRTEQSPSRYLGSREREAELEKLAKEVKKENSVDKFARGARGEHLISLQERLSINGYSTNGADGVFGSGTENAVKAFQKDKKIPITGKIDKKTKELIESLPGKPTKFKKKIVMEATAYSSEDPGNGSYTARGNFLRRGLIAVDPDVIPLGTSLYIEGYGYAVADDIGGAIKGRRVDLGMNSHGEAIQFGRRDVVVYIL